MKTVELTDDAYSHILLKYSTALNKYKREAEDHAAFIKSRGGNVDDWHYMNKIRAETKEAEYAEIVKQLMQAL